MRKKKQLVGKAMSHNPRMATRYVGMYWGGSADSPSGHTWQQDYHKDKLAWLWRMVKVTRCKWPRSRMEGARSIEQQYRPNARRDDGVLRLTAKYKFERIRNSQSMTPQRTRVQSFRNHADEIRHGRLPTMYTTQI